MAGTTRILKWSSLVANQLFPIVMGSKRPSSENRLVAVPEARPDAAKKLKGSFTCTMCKKNFQAGLSSSDGLQHTWKDHCLLP